MASRSPIDDRTPVLVGTGQFIQRPEVPTDALEPVAMMQEAVERAADDAGARRLLDEATDIWVVAGAWSYTDPGAILADRFAADARTGLSAMGGNAPQSLVNAACRRIQAGAADVVIITGAEGIWSRRRARRVGERIPYTEQTDATPTERIGDDVVMSHPIEEARGFDAPIVMYPIFESAIRASLGETIDEHRDRLGALWVAFNEVACRNEYAWLRTPMTAEQIRSPEHGNRMVGFPYTRAMNSNWDLDLAAALILCSADAARRVEVPRDRWVFPHSGTDGADTPHVSNRWQLDASPAIRIAGRRALELAGVGADDLAHVDLYSCFPSAVQIGARELGIGLDRQLTVTGGLTFAGGPLNNYVCHSVATMASVLRDDPGSIGLCTANGGFVTKHAFGVYSTTPPSKGFATDDCQPTIDDEPRREFDPDHTGPATIEAYTVMHGVDGPERAMVAVRTPAEARQWATSTDAMLMEAMMRDEHIGHEAEIRADFTLRC